MGATKDTDCEDCCSTRCLRHFLCAFNVYLIVAGCACFAVGLWHFMDRRPYTELLDTHMYSGVLTLNVACGALFIVTHFWGCISLRKMRKCALLVYTCLLLAIFMLLTVTGALAYVYEDHVTQELSESLNQTMVTSYSVDKAQTAAINDLQKQFKCCGARGFEDWKKTAWYKKQKKTFNKVPDSCCKTIRIGCGKLDHPSNIYYDVRTHHAPSSGGSVVLAGCAVGIARDLQDNLCVIGVLSLGLSIIHRCLERLVLITIVWISRTVVESSFIYPGPLEQAAYIHHAGVENQQIFLSHPQPGLPVLQHIPFQQPVQQFPLVKYFLQPTIYEPKYVQPERLAVSTKYEYRHYVPVPTYYQPLPVIKAAPIVKTPPVTVQTSKPKRTINRNSSQLPRWTYTQMGLIYDFPKNNKGYGGGYEPDDYLGKKAYTAIEYRNHHNLISRGLPSPGY